MTKNILYVAAAKDLATGARLETSKIGIASNEADKRIKQLNSTKMTISVELSGAWTFELTGLDAAQVEKAAHYLLSPFNVNGEWFQDPDDDLADRVGKFAEKLGAKPVGDTSPELHELNDKQRAALDQMRTVFEPIRQQLTDLGVDWEYMTYKVGMDSPLGRLNISVRKNGQLYVRLRNKEKSAAELTRDTGIDWRDGVESLRHSDMTSAQLVSMFQSIAD